MERNPHRRHCATATSMLCLLLVFLTAVGHAAPKRGDAPQCQADCLTQHRIKMDKLTQDYELTRNRVDYQEKVDKTVAEYFSCIENCKEPYPVK